MIKAFYFILLFSVVGACIDPYAPPVRAYGLNLLVVDGFINPNGPSEFRLSRTSELIGEENAVLEQNAILEIQGEDDTRTTLEETIPGVYRHDYPDIDPSVKYRLYIRTSKQIEYASEFVPVLISPPIDSLTWEIQSDGAQIFVNTHDPTGKTRYYQWEYEETWHYRSQYCTILEYRDGAIRRMESILDIHNCWKSDHSDGRILISSTDRLLQDVVHEFPVIKLPSHTEKLQVTYSILVRQWALTKSGYEFMSMLKKNTESVGGIFDPFPTSLTGNIVCLTNPEEPVIGFVSARDSKEMRLFIDRAEIEFLDQFVVYPPGLCLEEVIPAGHDSTTFFRILKEYYELGLVLPVNPPGPPLEIYPDELGMDTIPFALNRCVDCRFYGTNRKPEYWPPFLESMAFGCNE